jgi:putative DNA primase/helicase
MSAHDTPREAPLEPNWLRVKPENVPDELKALPCCVSNPVSVWNESDGDWRWTKPPSHPVTGRNIGTNRPEEWADFDTCAAAVLSGKWKLMGGLLPEESGIVGYDVDKIKRHGTLDRNPAVKSAIREYQKRGGYVERSPSGDGLRIFAKGDPVTGRKKSNDLEMYSDHRYLTITGHGGGALLDDTGLREAFMAAIGSGGESAQEEGQGPDKALATPSAATANGVKVTDDLLYRIEAATREELGDAADTFIPAGEMDGIKIGYPGRSEQAYEVGKIITAKALEAGVSTDEATLQGVVHEVGNHLPVIQAWTDARGSKWDRTDTVKNAVAKILERWKGAKAPQAGEIGIHGDQGDLFNGRGVAGLARGKFCRVYETGDILAYGPDIGHVRAEPNAEFRLAEAWIDRLKEKASAMVREQPDDPKVKRLLAHITRSSSLPKMRDMIDVAFAQPGMTRRLSEFDADPYKLGCVNGRLDVKRGTLLPFTEDCPITKRIRAAHDPLAPAPIWQGFLERVLPDETVRGYLQRFFSMCLVGEVTEHIFLFMYGTGANGKSVFVEAMNWLLGDYSIRIPTEMLMRHQNNPQGPSAHIVALRGKRLAFANETTEGSFLDEARVKEMTGGDTMTGRVPYAREPVTFDPSHKLVGVGNHHPNVSDNGDGIWRRISLVPFEVTIPREEQDPHLLTKLKSEGAGILNWLLDGYREYRRIGLAIPKRIMAETAAYREEQDLLLDFLRECEFITLQPGEVSQKAAAYRLYTEWAKDSGLKPMSAKSFTRRIRAHGVRTDAGRRHYVGLRCGNPQPGGGVAAA